jgi:hypothetical protein
MHGRGDNDSERETRRKLFLKRVREDAEEKKWERRGGDDEVRFPPEEQWGPFWLTIH